VLTQAPVKSGGFCASTVGQRRTSLRCGRCEVSAFDIVSHLCYFSEWRFEMAHRRDMQQTIERIVTRIVEQYRPEKIILFGSYACGEPDAGSDVDLLIVKETNQRPIDRRITVRRIVHTSRCGMPFSPLVITPQELTQRLEMGDPFYHEIVDRGKVQYVRS
jgi:hypothetical protein